MPNSVISKLVQAWAEAHISLAHTPSSRAMPYAERAGINSKVLDQLIIWRLFVSDIVAHNKAEGKGKMAQRKWTIEVLADFEDADKNGVITNVVRNAAALIAANTGLLSDGVKPQVVAYSEDFFGDHQEIALLAKGLPAHDLLNEQEAPSDELVEAMQGLKK